MPRRHNVAPFPPLDGALFTRRVNALIAHHLYGKSVVRVLVTNATTGDAEPAFNVVEFNTVRPVPHYSSDLATAMRALNVLQEDLTDDVPLLTRLNDAVRLGLGDAVDRSYTSSQIALALCCTMLDVLGVTIPEDATHA